MDSICRLCHSTAFVSNNIFDEETALHIKMSLCLPVKIVKNDGLPQKICDKCSCRVNDFYQYCNEVIEVQNRLKTATDTTVKTETNIKTSTSPIPQTVIDKETQTDIIIDISCIKKEQEADNIETEYQVQKYEDDVKYNYSSDGSDDLSLQKIRELKNEKSQVDLNEVLSKLSRTCDLVVKNIDNDMDGIEDEKKIDTYVCCICDYTCLTKIDLTKHYRSHRVNSGKPPPAPAFPEDSDSVKCNRCYIKLVCEKSWSRHWTNHWKRDNCPYTCTKCHKGFLDINAIVKHGVKHQLENNVKDLEKVFVCDICPESFAHMRTLSSHRTKAHPESQNRPLNPRCGICGRTFTHSTSLQRHSRVHHSQRDTFLCTVCGKTLSSKEHLKFHMHIHLQYKPNVCKTCGKAFVKKCNLTLHERVHSGERPHVCTHCGKAFSQRSTLVIHERYHSGSRPYVCNLCGRGFVAKGLLSMHMKNTCI